MSRVGKYIFIIVAVCSLLVGGIFFFLKKDGYKVTFNSNGGSIVESVTTGFKKTVSKQMIQCVQGIILWGGIWIKKNLIFLLK